MYSSPGWKLTATLLFVAAAVALTWKLQDGFGAYDDQSVELDTEHKEAEAAFIISVAADQEGETSVDLRFDALNSYGVTDFSAFCSSAIALVDRSTAVQKLDGAIVGQIERDVVEQTLAVCSRLTVATASEISALAHLWIEMVLDFQSRGDAPQSSAGIIPADLQSQMRVAGGMIVAILQRIDLVNIWAIYGFGHAYGDVGEIARTPRFFDIEAELHLSEAHLCPMTDIPDCQAHPLKSASQALVDSGRWHNDVDRLFRAVQLVRDGMAAAEARPSINGSGGMSDDFRFSSNIILGNAHSYAVGFIEDNRKLEMINLAIADYERELEYAEEHAPSHDSAMLWQNLGASYAERGHYKTNARDFARAVELQKSSLEYFTPEDHPQSWSRSMTNMSAVQSAMAKVEKSLVRHDEAIQTLSNAVSKLQEIKNDLDAAYARYRLADKFVSKALTADQLRRTLRAKEDAGTERGSSENGHLSSQLLLEIAQESYESALEQLGPAIAILDKAGSTDYARWAVDLRTWIKTDQERLVRVAKR